MFVRLLEIREAHACFEEVLKCCDLTARGGMSQIVQEDASVKSRREVHESFSVREIVF